MAKPTPAQDLDIVVYDLLGRQIIRPSLSDIRTISAATFKWDGTDEQGRKRPNGVYLIVVQLKNGQKLAEKVVIQR